MQSAPTEKIITNVPQPKSYRSHNDNAVVERTIVPDLCQLYKRIGRNGVQHSIDVDQGELFADFIDLEINKIEVLGRMLCQSDEDTCFGYVLLDQIHAFKERLHQAAHHIERSVGKIHIAQTNLLERKYHIDTVIDAELEPVKKIE